MHKISLIFTVLSLTVWGCSTKNIGESDSAANLNQRAKVIAFEDMDSAMVLTDRAVRMAKATDDYKELAEAYATYGWVADEKRQFTRALEWWSKSQSILVENNVSNTSRMVKNLKNIGRVCHLWQLYNKAIVHYDSAISIAKNNNKELLAGLYYNKGFSLIKNQNYNDALVYMELAVTKSLEDGSATRAANSLMKLGYVSLGLEKYTDARDYFNRVMEVRDLPDKEVRKKVGIVYHQLGYTYFIEGRHNEALEMYEKSLSKRREYEQGGEFITLKDIGAVYLAKGDYDKAIVHLHEAEALVDGERLSSESLTLYKYLKDCYYKRDESKYLHYDSVLYAKNEVLHQRQDEINQASNEYLYYNAMHSSRTAKSLEQTIEELAGTINLLIPFAVLAGVVILLLFIATRRERVKKSKRKAAARALAERYSNAIDRHSRS